MLTGGKIEGGERIAENIRPTYRKDYIRVMDREWNGRKEKLRKEGFINVEELKETIL